LSELPPHYRDAFVLTAINGLSLEDAAGAVSLSPKYLSRVFKEVTGTGFMDYKLKIKIDKAKELLKGTGSTISEISDKLGFMNPESFTRIFKKSRAPRLQNSGKRRKQSVEKYLH